MSVAVVVVIRAHPRGGTIPHWSVSSLISLDPVRPPAHWETVVVVRWFLRSSLFVSALSFPRRACQIIHTSMRLLAASVWPRVVVDQVSVSLAWRYLVC